MIILSFDNECKWRAENCFKMNLIFSCTSRGQSLIYYWELNFLLLGWFKKNIDCYYETASFNWRILNYIAKKETQEDCARKKLK